MTRTESDESILDHPAISGQYLFPQDRSVPGAFEAEVPGAKLACYQHVRDPEQMTVVHFHGNGEAVADYVPDLVDVFNELSVNGLLVEYRQYGASTGKAQLVAMLRDGAAVIEAAGVPMEKVVAFGRSIGSLYAIELAYRHPEIAGLVLESSIADPTERFLTYADLRAVDFDEAAVHTEAKKHFNHRQKLSHYDGPVLILHTENDGLVDISHAERNYKWSASNAKRLVRFPNGDHNSIMMVNWNEYVDCLQSFLKQIGKLPSDGRIHQRIGVSTNGN